MRLISPPERRAVQGMPDSPSKLGLITNQEIHDTRKDTQKKKRCAFAIDDQGGSGHRGKQGWSDKPGGALRRVGPLL